MNKKEYIVGQLGRTKNKKYEAYVVTRIIHLLDDFDIKFVTQQYVSRPKGRALTDLFFPQFGIHVEVDEEHHSTSYNTKLDKIRKADIINATKHKVLRVNTTKSQSLDSINAEIDNIVKELQRAKKDSSFTPWDIESEFKPETYIKRGYIDVSDNVAFKTIKDACNCFGHNYSGCQRSGIPHKHEPNTLLWFPKLFPNEEWDNEISDDENTIKEKNTNRKKALEHQHKIKNNKEKYPHRRIVFAKVKGNLGDVLYRFRGEYMLNLSESSERNGLVWNRKSTKVKTYPCDKN